METFSALLGHCAKNSAVTGEFPSQRPVIRSFDIFFDVRLYKRLSKQSRRQWFEAPSHPLWRRCKWLHLYDSLSVSEIQRGCRWRCPWYQIFTMVIYLNNTLDVFVSVGIYDQTPSVYHCLHNHSGYDGDKFIRQPKICMSQSKQMILGSDYVARPGLLQLTASFTYM